MEYPDYKSLVKTPEAHAEFLTAIAEKAEEIKDPGGLFLWMTTRIKVDGKPFSQAKHLTTLENSSDSWEVEEMDPAVTEKIVNHSAAIAQLDKGYDLPFFTSGFHLLVGDLKDRGIPVPESMDASRSKIKPT